MQDDIDFHPVTLAADTADMQGGTLSRITEAIRFGVPSAAISGAMSIYNTMVDLVGGNAQDIGEVVTRYDAEMGSYYQDNKSAVDIVGFVAGAIPTGGLGMMSLKLARSGLPAGAASRYLNMPVVMRERYLKEGLAQVAEGAAVPSILSASRRKQLLWETADQAMLGLSAELAIAATMNASPVFEGDSLSDFGWNIMLGTVLSGGVGGPLAALAAKGTLASASEVVQKQLRLADTVFNPEKLGLAKGTEAWLMSEDMAKLTDAIKSVDFQYKFDGKLATETLDISKAAEAAKLRATQRATEDLKLKFNQLAEGNEAVGQAYFNFIKDATEAAKATGKTDDEVLQTIYGYLNNVKHVGAIDLEKAALDARSFYVDLFPTGATPEEKVKNIFTLKRSTTAKNKYAIQEGVEQSDVVIKTMDELGETQLKAAFKNNPDVDMVQLPDGSMRVNPDSPRVTRIYEPAGQYKLFVDLESGTLSPETVVRFGDIIDGKGVKIGNKFVEAGKRVFQQADHVPTETIADPLAAGARYAWASKLEPAALLRVVGNQVHMDDLPVLARLVELEPQIAFDTLNKLKFMDGAVERKYTDFVSMQAVLDEQRRKLLAKELNNWVPSKQGSVPDVRVFAAKLNTDAQWVEEAIDRGFAAAHPNTPGAGKTYQTAEAMTPRSLQVTWDFEHVVGKGDPGTAYTMNMGPRHLMTQQLSAHYQSAIREQINSQAARAVLESDADLFLSADKDLARQASNRGAGATLAGASNAGYGQRAELFAQDTGKNVALVAQKRRDAAILSMAAETNAIRATPRAAAELGILTTALRKSPYRFVFDPAGGGRIVAQEAVDLSKQLRISIDDAITALMREAPQHQAAFKLGSVEVENFLKQATRLNDTRQGKFTTLKNAMGQTAQHTPGVIYVPPVNTVKYPYHAFVRTKEKLGLASETTMITAKSEDQLRELAAAVGDDYDVFFKDNTAKYFKAKGEYDYAMTMSDPRVNSELARKGKLADFFPETNAENVLTDWLEHVGKQEERLVRNAVQVMNRRFFAEMEFLSGQYRQASESVTRGIGSRFKTKVADPYGDYIKTALNVSKQQEFPLLDSLNEFIDKLGMKAGDAILKGFKDAQAGQIPWDEANKIMKQYGMGNLYENAETYLVANERYPRNVIRETVQKANMFLATTLLRLDFANSLLNMISTPIMLGTEMASIKGLIKNDSALAGQLAELTSIKVPGRNMRVPSTTKLIADSIGDYFGPDKAMLMARYREMGAIKDVSKLYHEVLDDLSYLPGSKVPEWKARVDAAVEKGAKITGNTFAEDFTRFVSANVMKKLTDPLVAAKRMDAKTQNAYISTFVNRVQGNYVTSQRPIIFQGTTGAAISLFQTYAFNVLQQLHRHVQAGDKKTLAVFAGLQGSIFGLNGLPFFDAANTHIIGSWAANNPEHKDAYSTLPGFNKELGDWLLYGTASALPLFTGAMPALYTRGDINPRHPTLVPSSIEDVPAVAASLKLVDTVAGFYSNVTKGADFTDAAFQALEHQGLNRPLAGLAQLFSGRSTTSSGALISASNELSTNSWLMNMKDRMVNYGGVSRLLGARPMEEAVALNQLYRNKTYQAIDTARIERLGNVVKSRLRSDEAPSGEELDDFMLRYTRAGGDIQNFNRAMSRWYRDASTSVVNKTAQRMSSPYSRSLLTIMGGEELPDYTNSETIGDE